MKLLIMSLEQAIVYTPIEPTLAIRIFSRRYRSSEEDFHLINSELYKRFEYEFDDITPLNKRDIEIGYKLFDRELATKIIMDFQQNRDGRESLLVNCFRGLNRSPAVAIALNEIFRLGDNTGELKRKYSEANWYVYDMMIKTAERLDIK